jgi:hypothetical protein
MVTALSPATRECILATQSPPLRAEDIDGGDATVVLAHLGGELVDECTVRLLNSDGSVTDSRTVSLDPHSHSVLSIPSPHHIPWNPPDGMGNHLQAFTFTEVAGGL